MQYLHRYLNIAVVKYHSNSWNRRYLFLKTCTCLTFFVLLLFFGASEAAEIPNKVSPSHNVDGLLSESAWSNIKPLTLSHEIWPKNNTPTPIKYRTQVFVFEDGEKLYIGVVASDPNPEQIRANFYKRDNSKGDDLITISIDTFNQSQQAYIFSINPLGGQSDHISLARDYVPWNGFWESNGKLTDKGYTIEIAIPLKNFRFPVKDIQKWKINFKRTLQRDDKYVFSSSKNNRDNDCSICQYDEFTLFKHAKSASTVQLRPYVITTNERTKKYPYNEPYNTKNDNNSGVDIKWSPSGSQILNLTLKPDFSQVEADDAQFSVNRRFSAYYNEKRPFFLEGEEYFKTPLNLIHTRNISDPSYGIKYTNKSNNHVFGSFYVKDDITNIINSDLFSNTIDSLNQSSENIAVRYKNEFDNSGYVGFLATQRTSDNYKNTVSSVDGFHRLDKTKRITFQIANSINDYQGNHTSANAYNVAYNYNSAENWHWINYTTIEENFNSGIGFITQSGYRNKDYGIGHLWDNNSKKGLWNRIYLTAAGSREDSIKEVPSNSKTIYENKYIELNIDGKNKLDAYIVPSKTKEYFEGVNHNKSNLYMSIDYEVFKNISAGISTTKGDGINYSTNNLGKIKINSLWLNAVINSQLSFYSEYHKSKLNTFEGTVFDATINNVTVNYSLDFRHHIRLKYQQLNNIYPENNLKDKEKGFQFLYIYQLSAYSSIYIGHSQNLYEDQNTTKLQKYNNYTFVKLNHVFLM